MNIIKSTSSSFFILFLLVLFSFLFCICNGQVSHDPNDEDLGPSLITHSLLPPFLHNEYDNEWWDYGGNVVIRVYDYIRLTIQKQSQSGWIWSKTPLKANAFTIEFDFRIHGDNPSLFGDGFAFWYTNGKYEAGPVFGYKDKFTGLGIFFDTFPNGHHDHSFPYISAMLGDGKTEYDHANDNKGTLAGHGCEANIRGSSNALRARVTYYKNDVLKLEFTDNAQSGWQNCFVLSNVTLLESGYIGFTSRTGELYDNHDIYKVETHIHQHNEVYKGTDATDSHIHGESSRTTSSSSGGSIFGSILKLFGMGAIAAVLYVVYQHYSRKNMKRF